ncbi:MAG: carboxypeptidase regulatory-like domain-containing protein, partial [Alicyclobacillaceae bacterium]|nr:carboxypeptidase regulatory-like domain-containing protein [Alicyclobacillaceae bacterium]
LLASLSVFHGLPVQASRVPAPPPAVARSYRGTLVVAGRVWRNVPFVVSKGSNYIDVAVLTAWLNQYGWHASWTSGTLSAAGWPVYRAGSAVWLDGKRLSATGTIEVAGSPYVNLTALAQAENWRLKSDTARNTLEVTRRPSFVPRAPSPAASGHGATGGPAPPGVARSPVRTSPDGRYAAGWGAVDGWKPVPVLRSGSSAYVSVWYIMRWLKALGYNATWKPGTLMVQALPRIVSDGYLKVDELGQPTAMVAYQGSWYVPMSALLMAAGIAAGVDKQGGVHMVELPGGATSGQGTGGQPLRVASLPAAAGGLSLTVRFPKGITAMGAKLAFLQPNGDVAVLPVTTHGDQISTAGAAAARFAAGGDMTATVSLAVRQATLIAWYTPQTGWIGAASPVGPSVTTIQLADGSKPAAVSGTVAQPSGVLPFAVLDVRSDITHAHYLVRADGQGQFQTALPPGPYELWTVTAAGQTVFAGQRLFLAPGERSELNIRIPAQPQSGLYISRHCIVAAQSTDVSPLQLVSVARMFERIYSNDVEATGLDPLVPVVIQVYGTEAEYAQHFVDEAYSQADARHMAMYSQAVSESANSISLDLDGLTHEFAVDVLAHEFFHCLVSTASSSLPNWVNEGLAWYLGVRAELDRSPDDLVVSALQWNQWLDVVRHAAKGDLYPLAAGNSLAPRYNVEAQDYFAVDLLIQRYGLPTVMRYVRLVDSTGSAKAFQQVFGVSESAFAAQVANALKQAAGGQDRGIRVTVRVWPGGPSQLFVSNPKGATDWFTDVKPGVYTFVCKADGTVEAPAGVDRSVQTSSPADGMWDVGAEVGRTQGFFSISYAYGVASLQSTSMFYGTSQVPNVQVASALPFGLQLLAVAPLP